MARWPDSAAGEGTSGVGHTIAVSGGYGADGRVIANVVVIGKVFAPAR